MFDHGVRVRVFLFAGICALFAWGCPDDACDSPDGAYCPVPGAYTVAAPKRLVLYDPDRDHNLSIKIYHPEEAGPFPVILFSHGAGDSKEGAPLLTRFWCSHGYVCIHPSHFTEEEGTIPSYSLARFKLEFELLDLLGPLAWYDRVRDLTYIVDSFGELVELEPALAGKMDTARIGVGGHSLGGYTALLVGGVRVRDPLLGDFIEYSDGRVGPILVMSGPGNDDNELVEESWAPLTGPMMVMGGSRDPGFFGVAMGIPSSWRMEPFEYAPGTDKYSVFFEGARHLSYLGPMSIDEDAYWFDQWPGSPRDQAAAVLRPESAALAQGAIFGDVAVASLAFWDAYLKDAPDAIAFLRSGQLEARSAGTVSIEWK
ncbi:MAG TPA: hypothetical protein HPP83_12260 [Candidatus Hydrogenedentes bacterium]|nr:hypothetical protein [Candidatus Hydrogenedentota bacterium]